LGSRTHRVRSVEVDTDRSGEEVFPLVGVQTTLATSDSIIDILLRLKAEES